MLFWHTLNKQPYELEKHTPLAAIHLILIKNQRLDLFDQKVDTKRQVVVTLIFRPPHAEGPEHVENIKTIKLCTFPLCTLTRLSPIF
jgi:hypothetical protein